MQLRPQALLHFLDLAEHPKLRLAQFGRAE
jgi:hypothetical protein